MTSPGLPGGEEPSALLRRLPGTRLLDLTLTDARMLTPRLRRLRFGADELATLDAFPGQDLMVAVPAPGRAHFRRRYTIRRLLRSAAAVDLDVVLHGDGPGARWAGALEPGEHVEAIGPRGKIGLASDVRAHLFCGDESALPAIFAMVEALPPEASALCVLEVADSADELEPDDVGAALTLLWRHRQGAPGTGEVIAKALGDLELPPEPFFAYVFGEQRQVAAARRVLTGRGVDPERIAHKSYWRLGVANAAHGEPAREAAG